MRQPLVFVDEPGGVQDAEVPVGILQTLPKDTGPRGERLYRLPELLADVI